MPRKKPFTAAQMQDLMQSADQIWHTAQDAVDAAEGLMVSWPSDCLEAATGLLQASDKLAEVARKMILAARHDRDMKRLRTSLSADS